MNCDPHSLSCHQHPQLTRALAEPSTDHIARAIIRARARVNAKDPHYNLFYVSYFLSLAATGKASGQKRESGSLAIDKRRLEDCQSG